MRASGVKGFSLTIPIFEVSREVRLWLKGRAPRPDAKRPWVEPILESLESTGHAYLGWLGRLELMGHTSRWLRFRPTPEFGEAVRAAAASSAP